MSVLLGSHSSPGAAGGEDHSKANLEYECQIFDRGFGDFFQSGDFSDVMLVAKETGTEYHLHKIILAYSSKYFASYFDTMDKPKLPPGKPLPATTSNTNPSPSSTTAPSTPTSNGIPPTKNTSPTTASLTITNTTPAKPNETSNSPLRTSRGSTVSVPSPPSTTPPNNKPVPPPKRYSSQASGISNIINSINSNKNFAGVPENTSTTNTNTNNPNNNNSGEANIPGPTHSPLSILSPRPDPPLRRSLSKISTHSDEEDDEDDEALRISSSTGNLQDLLAELNSQEKDRVELSGPFTQYFHHVVKYMYEGSVEFTSENAIPLLAMSDFYQIKELRHAASDYLLSSITRENALLMLQKAIHFNAEEVASKCITMICKNFNQIASLNASQTPSTLQINHHIPTSNSTTTLNSLPISTIIRILKQNNLAAASEFVVYKTVCSYIEAHKELTPAEIHSLFETVRFPWLTYQQLTEIDENQLVPRHLLTEALFIRLKPHELPANAKKNETEDGGPQNSRLAPRAAYAISLEYHNDFDEHGLFYYIGTNAGKEEWSNPGMRGRVRVTCSSQEKGNIVDLVGRTSTECWSMDVPSSWVMINLGSSRSLVPNYYTLRHGGNSKADGLRNWTLQGSNDAKNWTVLIRHANDNSLNNNYASCSWPIPNCTQAYRYFRVLQNGRNSSNHNFLSLSGIEFYGDLYETRKDESGNFV